jgi:hypothetical protein
LTPNQQVAHPFTTMRTTPRMIVRFLAMGPLLALLGLPALELVGCGGGGDKTEACRARTPDHAGGVHGCVTQSSDVGNPPPPSAPLPDFSVEIFKSEPPSTSGDGLAPFAKATSDSDGYYEIELSPGDYWICTSFRRCVELDVPVGRSIAVDYDYGLGPGWSPR